MYSNKSLGLHSPIPPCFLLPLEGGCRVRVCEAALCRDLVLTSTMYLLLLHLRLRLLITQGCEASRFVSLVQPYRELHRIEAAIQ